MFHDNFDPEDHLDSEEFVIYRQAMTTANAMHDLAKLRYENELLKSDLKAEQRATIKRVSEGNDMLFGLLDKAIGKFDLV